MSCTIREALTKVQGPEFDRIVGYTKPRPTPKPVSNDVSIAFSGVKYELFREIARALSSRYKCQWVDAEDAVQSAFADIFERRPDLSRQKPESWLGYLHQCAKYRLLDIRKQSAETVSIDGLVEANGDSILDRAKPCIAESPIAQDETRRSPTPGAGESWTREQIIGSIQRFRDAYGRPPKSSEFKSLHLLPSIKVVYRHFGRLADALLAAGMIPDSTRRRTPWSAVDAAKTCEAFRRRNGYWPSWSEARRYPGDLPSTSAMIRYFGGTSALEVQQGSEAILHGM